jgi:uncharacterized membrane protein
VTDENSNPLPFVAPCKEHSFSAPFIWLRKGLGDARRAPLASLSYGLVMAVLIMLFTVLAWRYGSAWIVFSLLCGFVFAAPVACVGTYAISAQLERDLPVSLKRTLKACFQRYLGSELLVALVLLIIFLVWARASSAVSIFMPETGNYSTQEMTGYYGALATLALVFLSLTFAASVFSLPMIMHRDVDAITAVVTSINAVLRNKAVMALWGCLIGVGLVIGIATGGLLLILFLPAVGHAVWHGYLDTIDASEFPRHSGGITSTARKT